MPEKPTKFNTFLKSLTVMVPCGNENPYFILFSTGVEENQHIII